LYINQVDKLKENAARGKGATIYSGAKPPVRS